MTSYINSLINNKTMTLAIHPVAQARHPEWQTEPQLITTPEQILRARRPIHLLVIHCSATRSCDHYSPEQLIRDHVLRGFSGAGYHYYITREGLLYALRPVDIPGAHAKGHNQNSIGICYEGGLDPKGRPADTRTPAQRQMLTQLIHRLLETYPGAFVVGHRDLSPDRNGDGKVTPNEWTKVCPCFDAKLYNRDWIIPRYRNE